MCLSANWPSFFRVIWWHFACVKLEKIMRGRCIDSRNSAAKVCDCVISSWRWHLTGRTRQVCAVDASLSCCTKIFCVNHKNVSSVFSLTDCAMENHSVISRQNNLEMHLRCHTCWLSYFTLICLWCGRTGGRTDVRLRDCQNFSDG